jgi:hypothetical protein
LLDIVRHRCSSSSGYQTINTTPCKAALAPRLPSFGAMPVIAPSMVASIGRAKLTDAKIFSRRLAGGV